MREAARSIIDNEQICACGARRIAPNVTIAGVRRDDGSIAAHFDGLLRCGSVWACPVCAAHIRTQRADEVRRAVDAHGAGRVVMVTFTARHTAAQTLVDVERGIASSWRQMTRPGRFGKEKKSFGIVGQIRSSEQTHGKNGWHPHLHVLFFCESEVSAGYVRRLEEWFFERWHTAVLAAVGVDAEPDVEHGVKVTRCHHDGSYVSKMHLELTAPRGKSAKKGRRQPWDILEDYSTMQRPEDAALWREYVSAMHGKHQLEWSPGLKKRFGIGDKTDQQIVQGAEIAETAIATLRSEEWRAIRPAFRVRVLEAAEERRGEGVRALLVELGVRRAAPDFGEAGQSLVNIWEESCPPDP